MRLASGCCFLCFLFFSHALTARTYTVEEGKAAWAEARRQPITETSFRQVCDLIQDIGQNNLPFSYQILAEYVPMVSTTGHREWVHVLLMAWARAKESLTAYPAADSLYAIARANAPSSHMEDEALIGTVLLYLEWGRPDSLEKYLPISEKACLNDPEELSLMYTFRAMAHSQDTAAMRRDLMHAMDLSSNLPNKNALFTAKYNYAVICCASNPQVQVSELESCLEMTADSSLNHKPRLYERSGFYFRNPGPSVYYQLMQVNLLLADYANAGKFADMFYDATVRSRPGNPQAPYFDAEMAIVKMYQGDVAQARTFLAQSRSLFGVPEDSITYVSYFIGAGLLAEHDGKIAAAARYYARAAQTGSTEGLHITPPGMYYAHALILDGQLSKARQVLADYEPALAVRKYSAYGYFYYRNYADLLKAAGDYKGYAAALETYYTIKDSLANLNHYRAIQEVEAKLRLKDKEAQIALLDQENQHRLESLRRDRTYFILLASLSIGILILLTAYLRYRASSRLRQVEKEHRIDVMQNVIDAEESERRKIADRLHDEVGSDLALASLNLSSVLEAAPDAKLQKAQQMIATVSTTIRDISHRLTPLAIEQHGFRKAVEDLAESINLSGKLQLETVLVGFTGPDPYPIAFLNDLYRILQELLHNVLKHAHASHALMEVVEHEDHISIVVEDNGVGMPEAPTGKGLATIRSRMAYLGGIMNIETPREPGTPGGEAECGTIIVLDIPTTNHHENNHS